MCEFTHCFISVITESFIVLGVHAWIILKPCKGTLFYNNVQTFGDFNSFLLPDANVIDLHSKWQC